jgi:hypothetical protein
MNHFSRIGKWNREITPSAEVYVPRFDGCAPLENDLHPTRGGVKHDVAEAYASVTGSYYTWEDRHY